MIIDLTDDEAAALLRELDGLIDGDRYFMPQRVKTLKGDDPAGAGARTVAPAAEANMRHRGQQPDRDGALDASAADPERECIGHPTSGNRRDLPCSPLLLNPPPLTICRRSRGHQRRLADSARKRLPHLGY